jgi:hypothetical protein
MPARPSFARSFPELAALDQLVEAFARGDYAAVRAGAPELARTSSDPAVQEAARTLLDRTRPDPLAVGLLAIGAVLLVVLAAWAVVHGHAPPNHDPIVR